MTVTSWPVTVNTNFYNSKAQPLNNVTQTSFLSGRTIGWQNNTRNVMSITCSLSIKVGTESQAFWDWYNDDLGGTAGIFTCAALGNGYYRFSEIPSPENTSRDFRVLNLAIEEAY